MSARKPRNTSSEEQVIREAFVAWGRTRLGDVRVIHELALGRRRIDCVMVGAHDIVGGEIKGPRDSIGDRLDDQMREFNFYLPEVWLIVDEKWRDHANVIHHPNLLVYAGGVLIERKDREPDRDEMCCSRLIERLWTGEARRIAARHRLVQEQLLEKMPLTKVRKILARMLTGHEIMREVCTELRARPLVGIGSDPEAITSGRRGGRTP